MADTSLLAYFDPEAQAKRPTQKAQIVDALGRHGYLTRHQLSQYTGLPINVITGRVNELIKAGIVVVVRVEIDPDTNHDAEVLCLVPSPIVQVLQPSGSGQGYSRVAGHLKYKPETMDEIMNRGW
jgi:hypothetical protein